MPLEALMKRQFREAMLLALLSMVPFSSVLAAGLGGSLTSMRNQYHIAQANEFTFLRTAAQVEEFVEQNRLLPIANDEVLLMVDVSFPFARPSVALFIERLSEQYYAATGQRLVVTSLTRPISEQPSNAHELSVHPTGMAVDFRVPADTTARRWLENTLLSLEKSGVLDVTREKHPPHYHVAVYPAKYEQYVALHPTDTSASKRLRLEASARLAASLAPEPKAIRDTVETTALGAPATRPRTPAFLAIAGFTGLLGAGAIVRRRSRRSPSEGETPTEGAP